MSEKMFRWSVASTVIAVIIIASNLAVTYPAIKGPIIGLAVLAALSQVARLLTEASTTRSQNWEKATREAPKARQYLLTQLNGFPFNEGFPIDPEAEYEVISSYGLEYRAKVTVGYDKQKDWQVTCVSPLAAEVGLRLDQVFPEAHIAGWQKYTPRG